MAIEIELKAWVDDVEALKVRLDALGTRKGSYDKDDEYWKTDDPARSGGLRSGVRLRRLAGAAAGSAVVTFKNKEVRDGIEVNDEREFGVDDAEAFAELLSRLGFEPRIRKRKTGDAWDLDGVFAELSLLHGLGHFIELEVLEEIGDAAVVAAARARLERALDALGVDRGSIESRYYTEMLAAARAGKKVR